MINTATNAVIANITTGSGTYRVALSPDGSRAYVSNEFAGTVSVIDTGSNTVVGSITVGGDPTIVAVSPDGTRVYVINNGSGTVSVIDPASTRLRLLSTSEAALTASSLARTGPTRTSPREAPFRLSIRAAIQSSVLLILVHKPLASQSAPTVSNFM